MGNPEDPAAVHLEAVPARRLTASEILLYKEALTTNVAQWPAWLSSILGAALMASAVFVLKPVGTESSLTVYYYTLILGAILAAIGPITVAVGQRNAAKDLTADIAQLLEIDTGWSPLDLSRSGAGTAEVPTTPFRSATVSRWRWGYWGRKAGQSTAPAPELEYACLRQISYADECRRTVKDWQEKVIRLESAKAALQAAISQAGQKTQDEMQSARHEEAAAGKARDSAKQAADSAIREAYLASASMWVLGSRKLRSATENLNDALKRNGEEPLYDAKVQIAIEQFRQAAEEDGLIVRPQRAATT